MLLSAYLTIALIFGVINPNVLVLFPWRLLCLARKAFFVIYICTLCVCASWTCEKLIGWVVSLFSILRTINCLITRFSSAESKSRKLTTISSCAPHPLCNQKLRKRSYIRYRHHVCRVYFKSIMRIPAHVYEKYLWLWDSLCSVLNSSLSIEVFWL